MLDMTGHIDDVFRSIPATRYSTGTGGYVDGIYVPGTATETSHYVTLQALTDREIESLTGAERLVDVRKIYVNDAGSYTLTKQDYWEFDGLDGQYKVVAMDDRPWRSYAKLIISKRDQND